MKKDKIEVKTLEKTLESTEVVCVKRLSSLRHSTPTCVTDTGGHAHG